MPSITSIQRLAAWLIAGSTIYLVSAACILIGIAQILDPIWNRPDLAGEKFLCLGALNLYEVTLLAVTLLILFLRNVADDAVALVVLIAVFLIGSAAGLDVIAPDFPEATLAIGITGLAIAVPKLMALQRHVIGGLDRLSLVGVAGLLAWNFLMPGLLGHAQALRMVGTELAAVWLSGWLAALFAMLIIAVAAWRLPTRTMAVTDSIERVIDPAAFLRSGLMRWIVIGLLFTGTITHQFALTWAFSLPIACGDLLPGVPLLAFIALEVMRGTGQRNAFIESALAMTPLAAAVLVISGDAFTAQPGWNFMMINYPPVVLATAGLLLMLLAWGRRSVVLAAIAGGHLVAAVATWGVRPHMVMEFNNLFTGWALVIDSFLLLALGAALSLSKHRLRGRLGLT